MEAMKCAHCDGKGTCDTGKPGADNLKCACDKCLAWNRRRDEVSSAVGIPCSICWGSGYKGLSSFSLLIQAIMPALIAFCIVLASAIYVVKGDPKDAVLTFLGTLCGAVTGFYFGGRTQTKGKSIKS
jgi:hypothetical protein